MIQIRPATTRDIPYIRAVHLAAFDKDEAETVAGLATSLLTERSEPATISLVAAHGNSVIGHVAFSPVSIAEPGSWQGYILAPLGIDPDFQRRGIGSQLIETGIGKLNRQGCNCLLVYGDPHYYGRFGFDPDIAKDYVPPYPLEYPHGWQAQILHPSDIHTPVDFTCVESLSDPTMW